jgi:SAM-dependent methyltransferase
MDELTVLLKMRYRFFRKILSVVPKRKNRGYCPICEKNTVFVEFGDWLRDDYRCFYCNSIPRNRALIKAIQLFAPRYRDLVIHESSPGNQSSAHLKRNCRNYSDSQYFPDIKTGTFYKGFRCENLDKLTFADATFDLFVTSDVFEHIMNPDKAFCEIARVLKPGGMHIFTMPWYPELTASRRRATVDDNGSIFHLEEPVYHGNPVSDKGSLVTMDWGLDFCDRVFGFSGMTTTIYVEKDRQYGLDAKFLEVFISKKPGVS